MLRSYSDCAARPKPKGTVAISRRIQAKYTDFREKCQVETAPNHDEFTQKKRRVFGKHAKQTRGVGRRPERSLHLSRQNR